MDGDVFGGIVLNSLPVEIISVNNDVFGQENFSTIPAFDHQNLSADPYF